MKWLQFRLNPLGPVLVAACLVSACGGGSSGSPATFNQAQTGSPASAPVSGTTPMTMTCVDGPAFQCSGSILIRTKHGVGLTSSGVQAYGKSTSDLVAPSHEKTTAFGMAPASGGMAEVRLAKDSEGVVSEPRLLLSNLGISWNGQVERPPIIETFRTTQARVHLDANGKVVFSTLPGPSDYGYYDFADKQTAATQANYANNAYFLRSAANPPRCTNCSNYESTGAQFRKGDRRAGGLDPDFTTVVRLHGDGDVHAGNGKLDANGNPTILPGGSGIGVPFPGSKGYRGLDNWSFRYGNLSIWVTQDTVSIVEWAPGSDEHSNMRRGVVAFGEVTNPKDVPATGTATYSGIAYGWYTSDGSITRYPAFFRASVTVTVNFATREVSVSLRDAFENVATMPALPDVNFEATPKADPAEASDANYFTGPLANRSMTGGVSGRYFGPVIASGMNGAAPAELGGAFTMANPSTGAAAVGGFIALRGEAK